MRGHLRHALLAAALAGIGGVMTPVSAYATTAFAGTSSAAASASPFSEPGACAEGCPGSSSPPYETHLSKEAEEREAAYGAEAPERAAKREAEARAAAERAAKEASEREVKQRGAIEAAERRGREAAEREALARSGDCVVPRLRGDSLAKARRALRGAHCSLGEVHRPRKSGSLVVTRQASRAGSKLASGAAVGVMLGAPPARERRRARRQ